MSKPIEPGCKAVIINSHYGNDGIELVVVKKTGTTNPMYGDKWLVDTKLRGAQYDNEIPEGQLRRIDDYDGNEKVTWASLKDIWVPGQPVAV